MNEVLGFEKTDFESIDSTFDVFVCDQNTNLYRFGLVEKIAAEIKVGCVIGHSLSLVHHIAKIKEIHKFSVP